MAIDSANKRRSMLRLMPVADGTISGADRNHFLGLYSGIAVTVLVITTPDERLVVVEAENRFIIVGAESRYPVVEAEDRFIEVDDND